VDLIKRKLVSTDNSSSNSTENQNSNQTFEILAALAASDDVIYEQVLSQQLEEAIHVNEIADAYTKLAELYIKKGEKSDLFKAVIYISRALNIAYSDVRYNILAQLLNLQNNSEAIRQIGHRESEIKLLTDQLALQVGITEKFLLYARLSMIYQTGRASSYDNPQPPEMIKALSMRKEALSYLSIKNTRDIDIILVIDNNFAKHAAATITSILMNSNPETYYNFYIIMDPDKKVSPVNQQKISSLSSIQPSKFEFIEFDPNIMSDINKNMQDTMSVLDSVSSQWPKLIVYRLFLDKILPHLNKALYLDADIIVNEDLFKLFNKNIDDYYLGAAADTCNDYDRVSRLSSCSGKKSVYYFSE
jgi:hypothetical protein